MTAPIPPFPVAALVGIQQAGERAGWDDVPRTCAEAGDRCHGECTVNSLTGEILDPDCFRGEP